MEYIESPENRKVRDWASLAVKKNRQNARRFLLESTRGIEESLTYGVAPEALLLLEGTGLPEGISGRIPRIPCYTLSPKAFAKLTATENPRGIIGVYAFKQEKPGDVLDSSLLLFLDGIQDPGNLGTIVRSAAAFGLDGLLLGPGCVDLYNEKVLRSTLGGVFALPILSVDHDDLSLFRKHGFRILGASLGGEPLGSCDKTGKILMGIGNENSGLSKRFLDHAEGLVTIPIRREMESLNAGVAAGIILYEFNR